MQVPFGRGPARVAIALALALVADPGQLRAEGPPVGASASESPTVGDLTLDIRGDRLTLRADGIPLATILERLAATTGIIVHGKGPADERVTVSLEDVTLEQALRRVLEGYSAVLVFDEGRGVPGAVYLLSRREDSPARAVAAVEQAAETSLVELADDPEASVVEELDRRLTNEMQTLQDELQAMAREDPRRASVRLQELAADERPPARIEALHRLVGGERSALIAALAAALRDPEGNVQSVATQLLLDLQVDERTVAELVATAASDEEAARLLLAAALTR